MNTVLWYGVLAGLLTGAGVGGHSLRLVTLEGSANERKWVAWSGIVLYAVASAAALFQHSLGCWISILGPVVGITAVLVTGNKIDRFQIVLGVFQALAAIVAGALLLA